MAFDEHLADRIRNVFSKRTDVVEKKMFGGLCFMVSGNMCCGVVKNKLMARVGPDQYEELLEKEHASVMDFTKKPMKGMLYVDPEGLDDEADLEFWIKSCLKFTTSLPPK